MDLSMIDLLALTRRDTLLRRVAGTHGGEYAGACPNCGGTDRFRVQPEARDASGKRRGRWMCSHCTGRTTWRDAIDYVMHVHGLTFLESCRFLGLAPEEQATERPRPMLPPRAVEIPHDRWQERALDLCAISYTALWSKGGPAMRWLVGRGLSPDTIRAAGLGYTVEDRWERAEDWGLDPFQYERVWIPRGIAIPWWIDRKLWKVTIRRLAPGKRGEKYIALPGSANALYGVETVRPGKPAVLCEGVFDALAVQQEAGDLVGAAASGTTWARRFRWIARLSLCSRVLLAHDHDGEQKGEAAARYWRAVLGGIAIRWRPYLKDIGDMLEQGFDVRAWVQAGLSGLSCQEGDQ